MTAFLLFLFLTLNVSVAQERVGSGGSGTEAQLAAEQEILEFMTRKITDLFLYHKHDTDRDFPSVPHRAFLDLISRVQFEVTNKTLIDRHGIERSCLNYRDDDQIVCNYDALRELENDPKATYVLVFHELLSLLGIEETTPENPRRIDGYNVSRRLTKYLTKVGDYVLRFPVSCGLSGSLDERIKDCNYERDLYVLVTKTKDGKEIWSDNTLSILWGDILGAEFPREEAAKACENSFETFEGISGKWKLPMPHIFQLGERHNICQFLPNFDEKIFWMNESDQVFDGSLCRARDHKPLWASVRCVATFHRPPRH